MNPFLFFARVKDLKDGAWKSLFFDRLKVRAQEATGDRPRVWVRVQRAARLAGEHKTAFGNDYGYLRTLFRMLGAWVTAAYRPAAMTVVSALAVVFYLLNPLDFIPDLLPGIGLLDDASFFLWVLSKIRGELDRFTDWERSAPS